MVSEEPDSTKPRPEEVAAELKQEVHVTLDVHKRGHLKIGKDGREMSKTLSGELAR